MRSFNARPRRLRWTACTILLALSLTVARPRPAKAELTIATVTAVVFLVGAVGDALSKWKPLFAGSGPDLASQLNAVEVAILNELRTERNQAWRASAQQVFDNFAILGARPKNDPNNEPLRSSTLEISKNVFNQYALIVEGNSDFASSYQLAPMFSVLTGVHAGLTKMKGELNPLFPAVWKEYDIYYKRAMRTNNLLVGTTVSGCWPGYNPGAGKYVVINLPGYLTGARVPLNFNKSQLWKLLTSQWILATIHNYPKLEAACVPSTCNGSYPFMQCWGGTITLPGVNCMCGIQTVLKSTPCGQEAIATTTSIGADRNTGAFGSNGVVKIVRANMSAIMSVGGGDDRWSNSAIPTSGALTDPWLVEPVCGPTNLRSYVALP